MFAKPYTICFSYFFLIGPTFVIGDESAAEKTEWNILTDKIQQFQSEDRLNLLDILKSYHHVLCERSNLLSTNSKMKILNDELRMLLRRATA